MADGFAALLAPQEAAYVKTHGLLELFAEVLLLLVRFSPEDPSELLLELVMDAVQKMRARTSVSPPPAASRGAELMGSPDTALLMDAICDSDEASSRAVARALLRKHQLESCSWSPREFLARRSQNASVRLATRDPVISWRELSAMLQNLESAWGLSREDTNEATRQFKRRTFQNACHTEDGQQPKQAVENGLRVSVFEDNWLWVMRKVRLRRRPSTQAMRAKLSRRAFLRKSGKSFEETYEVLNDIGGGASGNVALCVHRLTEQLRAVKTIPKEYFQGGDETADLATEFEVLAALDHPHILRVFELLEDASAVHIAMEMVFGGTLKEAMQARFASASRGSVSPGSSAELPGLGGKTAPQQGRAPSRDASAHEHWAAEVTLQILDAVQYAHGRGVVHKDLKPQNVLLAAGAAAPGARAFVVVCDFGVAELTEAEHGASSHRFQRFGGTPHYIAPEVWQNDFSSKADLWSVGVILYELLSGGELPFTAGSTMALYRVVTAADSQADLTRLSGSYLGRDLCGALLEKNEVVRTSTSEALTRCRAWVAELAAQTPKPLPEQGASSRESCESLSGDGAAKAVWVKSLVKRSHLDKCVMACVASQLNVTTLRDINANFEHCDSKHSGRLGKLELTSLFAKMGLTPGQTEVVITLLDTNGDGEVEYSEFLAGCLDMRREQVVQQLKVVFSILDLDQSGYLSRDELEAWLDPRTPRMMSTITGCNRGSSNTTFFATRSHASTLLLPEGALVDDILEELDVSGDGKVSYEEFRAYLMRDLCINDVGAHRFNSMQQM